jgi:branched-chain amino acid transport system ATP-binding protein
VSGDSILVVDGLDVGYGQVPVLRGCSLEVPRGQVVCLLGRNGAGKSTLLRALSGLLSPKKGRVTFDGRDITGGYPRDVVEAGLLHVAEGHRVFRRQSVRANLEIGFYGTKLGKAEESRRLDHVFELFPALHDYIDNAAGVLSGGQQQMLAIAQALLRDPKLLMVDEPSLGLAPIVIDAVFAALGRLRDEGVTVLLVEQVIDRALDLADYGYVLQNGRVAAGGTPGDLRDTDVLAQAYLATPAGTPHDGGR